MLNLWLDALPEKAKARVVRWQNWCSGSIIHDDGRAKDLIGVGENWFGIRAHDWAAVEARSTVARRYKRWSPPAHASVLDLLGGRWDRLVQRVGINEAVRLIKARAAKNDTKLVEKYLLDEGTILT